MADIFHVITDMGVGGAGVLLSHLLSSDSERLGSLVVLPEESLLCSLLEEKDISYLTFPTKKECSLSFLDTCRIGRILEAHMPRLVVSHASMSSRLAAKRLKIPTLSVRHCDTPIRPLGVPLYNAVTDATIATSRPLAEHLRAAGVKKVHAIENGHTAMGVPTKKRRQAARAALAFPEECTVIGLSGRLSPIKGQETALRALSLLGEGKERFLLCFLGKGEDEGRLRRLSYELGVENRVRFLGYSPDVRRFYHAIDAHICCSLGSETASLALAEGMSAGCPTLASDTEGNRARVGKGGVFFPPGDAVALKRLFLSLLDEKARMRLARRARLWADGLPTWEEMREDYRRIFDAF